jgi:hypothetical protein
MALERGRGPASVPVRTTIGAAAVGLGALAGSLTFGASLAHLLGSPPLFGVTWDTEIWNNNGPAAVPAAVPVARADPDIAVAAFIQTGVDFLLAGHSVPGFALAPVKGNFAVSTLTGRASAAADEVALGTRTAAQFGAHAGSSLRGNAENQWAPQVPVRVTATVVLPPGDIGAHLGDGVIATRQALLLRLAGGQARSPYVIAVAFRPGVDTAAAVARLDRRLCAVDQNFFTQPPTAPTDLVNFGRIQDLPLILGSVLAVMAFVTMAHLLGTSGRRRRRDLAILKALGFTRGRRRPDGDLAGGDAGGGIARRRRSPRDGRRPDRLAAVRRASRRDLRRFDAGGATGARHTGHYRAHLPHLDRPGRGHDADPPGCGAASGVNLRCPLVLPVRRTGQRRYLPCTSVYLWLALLTNPPGSCIPAWWLFPDGLHLSVAECSAATQPIDCGGRVLRCLWTGWTKGCGVTFPVPVALAPLPLSRSR